MNEEKMILRSWIMAGVILTHGLLLYGCNSIDTNGYYYKSNKPQEKYCEILKGNVVNYVKFVPCSKLK